MSWSGGNIKPGSVKVDLSRGEFKAACRVGDITVRKPGPIHAKLPFTPELNSVWHQVALIL